MSRLLLLRLGAGGDLIDGIEAACRDHAICEAIVRGGPGSLMRAGLETGGGIIEVPGPAAEILTMVGEIHQGRASLHGSVGDPSGRVYAGRFARGRNPVCITVELVVEDIGPNEMARSSPSEEVGE